MPISHTIMLLAGMLILALMARPMAERHKLPFAAVLVLTSPAAAQLPAIFPAGSAWKDLFYPKVFWTSRDGLAAGASALTFGAFTLIGVFQWGQSCAASLTPGCYTVRDPLDLSVFAVACAASCFGFLWWNTSPARIFMGDTGSLALGGAMAALAIMSRTEMLLILLGGLFVIITLSVIAQVGSFKLTGRRVLRMAPLHHHFEMAGWQEITIVVRFWLIQGLAISAGLSIFYAEWISV